MTFKFYLSVFIISIGISGCRFFITSEISMNTNYVRIQDKVWMPLDFKNRHVVVHQPAFELDSVDLSRYALKNNYSITAETFNPVVARFNEAHKAFYKQLLPDSTAITEGKPLFDQLVSVKVANLSRIFYNDDNTFLDKYSANSPTLKMKFTDTLIHIVAKIVFRQDVCYGCGSDGFSFGVFGVYHYKLSMIEKDRVIYYREYLIPQKLQTKVVKHKRFDNAAHWFTKDGETILFKKLAQDLKRMGL
jgi:hypothetical protein